MKVHYEYLKTACLFLCSLALTCHSPRVFAQSEDEELKMDLQLRPRSEVRNGLFTPLLEGQQAAAFTSQRSRIGLTYTRNKKLKVGMSTQVVSTWGNDGQVQLTANEFTLYEAWAQIYFDAHWSIKAGRQVLSYDDERILGALDWNQAARKHDAVLLGYEEGKIKASLAAAFNQNSEKVTGTFFDNQVSQPYKSMEFLWMKYDFTSVLSASALAMNLDFQSRVDSSVSHLQTVGGNVFYNDEKWKLTGTFYFQTGRGPATNLIHNETNAWMGAVKADWKVTGKVGLGLGSDYLSGRDMNSTSTAITYFTPLYGTHHKFYGAMDYFYVSSPHQNVGLWDCYVNLNNHFSDRVTSQLSLHHFESAAKIIDYNEQEVSHSLGNEADVTLSYAIMKDAKLTGGYSQMFTDPSMKYVKNILENQQMKPVQNWIWLSLSIHPEVLVCHSKTK